MPAHLGLLQVIRRVQRDELALADEADALAQFRFVHVVRGHEHRHAFLRHGVDEAPELAAADGIDAGGRFIQEDDLRLVDDGASQGEALLPAAGEIGRECIFAPDQPGHVQDVGLALAQLLARKAVGLPVEADVLAGGEVVVEREELRHVADERLHRLGLRGGIVAEHARLAGRRFEQAEQHADGRRLARAVRSEPAVDFPRADVEAHVVHGGEAAELLAEIVDFDCVFHTFYLVIRDT